MFQAGQLIIYGSTGVCRVEQVCGAKEVPGGDPRRQYYCLRPIHATEVIYTPVDAKVFMRPVVSKEEAHSIIQRIPDIRACVYDNRNLKLLSDHYQQSLSSHDCDDLVGLIKSVYAKKQTVQKTGRKLGQTDQRYMKRAEELLYGELSAALEIPYDEVQPYIARFVHEYEHAHREPVTAEG